MGAAAAVGGQGPIGHYPRRRGRFPGSLSLHLLRSLRSTVSRWYLRSRTEQFYSGGGGRSGRGEKENLNRFFFYLPVALVGKYLQPAGVKSEIGSDHVRQSRLLSRIIVHIIIIGQVTSVRL